MRDRPGGFDPARRHAGGPRPGAEAERVVAGRRTRQSADTDGDMGAMRLIWSLEDAVLTLDTQPAGFEEASRKAEHVEELRRVLGILLDVLADWEMLADREAQGP